MDRSVFFGVRGLNAVGQRWTSSIYILKSGVNWYKREISNALGYFKLHYSNDSGATWDELFTLDLTEADVVIDLTHVYTHRINGTAYEVLSGTDIIYST